MNARQILVAIVKLIVCGLAYFIGLIAGGMLTSALKLPPPPMPDGVSQSQALLGLLFASPAMALGLALVAPRLAGGWPLRALLLTGLLYVAYTVNTVLDASLYLTAFASTSAFTLLSALVPSLFCGAAAAWLFAPAGPRAGFVAALRAFFRQRAAGQWLWRLALAALAFAPVYIFFGLLVNPFTGAYYAQHMYGLQTATWGQILPVQLARSLLFLLACLPVIVTWPGSTRSLFFSLGGALFALVGLTMVLVGTWLPWSVRLPHLIEILADSFVYVYALVWLLARPTTAAAPQPAAGRLHHAEG